MGWIDKRPQTLTGQFLEYATTGRLIEIRATQTAGPMIAVAIGAAAAIGLGTGLLALGLLGNAGEVATLVGTVACVAGLVVLAPAIRLLREITSSPRIPIRHGAVLPPDLVRKGNWIHRRGAWLRVEQVGRDGRGRVNALLGSGEVVELRTPVTVAGDHFRPVADPVESLRN